MEIKIRQIEIRIKNNISTLILEGNTVAISIQIRMEILGFKVEFEYFQKLSPHGYIKTDA